MRAGAFRRRSDHSHAEVIGGRNEGRAGPEEAVKCLVCALDRPRGAFDERTGSAVCAGCRDAARPPARPREVWSASFLPDGCGWLAVAGLFERREDAQARCDAANAGEGGRHLYRAVRLEVAPALL